MLAALGIFFAVVWVLALITMKTASAVIHLLLVVAVVSFIAHTVRSAGRTPTDPII
jgi:hypothetical protein